MGERRVAVPLEDALYEKVRLRAFQKRVSIPKLLQDIIDSGLSETLERTALTAQAEEIVEPEEPKS